MRAIITDPSAPAALRLADVPEPVAGPGQVLLEVHHASLNHGDLNDARSGRVGPGGVLGSDAAGDVTAALGDRRRLSQAAARTRPAHRPGRGPAAARQDAPGGQQTTPAPTPAPVPDPTREP
jgi:NADPH:quinone reductase-like Zn-dependent oxidoreductase